MSSNKSETRVQCFPLVDTSSAYPVAVPGFELRTSDMREVSGKKIVWAIENEHEIVVEEDKDPVSKFFAHRLIGITQWLGNRSESFEPITFRQIGLILNGLTMSDWITVRRSVRTQTGYGISHPSITGFASRYHVLTGSSNDDFSNERMKSRLDFQNLQQSLNKSQVDCRNHKRRHNHKTTVIRLCHLCQMRMRRSGLREEQHLADKLRRVIKRRPAQSTRFDLIHRLTNGYVTITRVNLTLSIRGGGTWKVKMYT
ncbi:hypothetical protein CLF_111363 [Clonorchis sinensis]|uniref:Uncharacterized protein n=1 Tax=Clonorchis sinensis TaxID=79923 RepID=G7YUQ3_CLOSI|nr:hypothetical protein CLF_111363 [Clonorchis sinensis]